MRRYLISPRNCTRAGSCVDSATSIYCVCSRNAGFRNRSLDAAKVIFRAPLDSFQMDPEPRFVAQLLSEDSLRRTGYLMVSEVTRWRKGFREMRAGSLPRLSVEMGLTAVVATQLWHHQFMAAAWQICLSGPPPKHLCKRRSSVAGRLIIPAFARFAFRSLSSPGHPSLCQAWPSPFECTWRASSLRPICA